MENVIVRYSDFFENDGGFDKIRRDFDALGDDLIKKAKEVKEKTKFLDVDQSEEIKEAEKQAETLTEAFKNYGEAKEDLEKIEKEFKKIMNESTKSTMKYSDALDKLNVEMEAHKTALKVLNEAEKQGAISVEDASVARGRLRLEMKKLTKDIQLHEKEIIASNTLSIKEQKLIKAKITIQKEQIKTLDDVRERMSALRAVVQSLDLETEADQIKKYNDEINDLTEVLSQNSDKFIQNKINIGNYEESIRNALKGTKLFTTGISQLDVVLDATIGFLFVTKKEIEEMEKAGDGNIGMLKRFTIAFGKLNKVLKASIIGVVLVAIGALASAFGDTRAGAVRLEKVMMSLSSAFTTFGKVAGIIFNVIVDGFGLVFESVTQGFDALKNLSLKEILTGDVKLFEVIGKNSSKLFSNLKKSLSDLKGAFKSGTDAVVAGLENIDRAYKLEDNIRRLNQEIEVLNGKLSIAQLRADDATKSLATQLLNNKIALELTETLAQKQLYIAQQQLELANEKVKQNIKANVTEAKNINLGLQGRDFAKATLDLAQKRGVQLEISNDLIDAQQTAVEEVIKLENDLNLKREENAKKQREINRDIFEQNLDLLIDIIDTEKNLSEQYVNDVTKNFKRRVNEFNRFLMVFRVNAQRELDEFTKEASNLGLDLDFSIQYDDNGDFQVFVNDTLLATDNIIELNKQLQGLGLNEIDINRFREFIVESRNGVRDFRLLNKELVAVGINVKEISSNVLVSQDELNALDSLQLKINKLIEAQRNATNTKERNKIAKEIIELEKQKTAIQEFADETRLENRRDAIDAELETVEEGSQRYYELLNERLAIEKDLKQKQIDEALKQQKEANDKALEDYKKFADGVRQVLDAVLDKVLEVNQKRIDSAKEQVDKQSELINIQRERAQAGLENTLAFEQRELGKREAELIKRQKKQERLEKVKALYSSYNNYSSRGDENPIAKALRDFAILEAISASFGQGGIVEDKMADKNKGIIRGRSHQGKQGGIPILVEGREGIFSAREMGNLGKDNFYKMKDLASMGKVDSNFFTRQRQQFVQSTNMIVADPELKNEIRKVKEAVERKPVSNWNVGNITKSTMEVVEEIQEKNSVKRNHYIVKKPRL